LILDTSGLLAAMDGSDPLHEACVTAVRQATGPLLLSPFVVAELDYLLSKSVGRRGARRFLREVADGAYRLEPFASADVRQCLDVLDRYADLDIGIADASLVVLAKRHSTLDLLTLDHRHFRAVMGPGNRPFRLLPADAA
jgi:predicted nucleic acid-binding protein